MHARGSGEAPKRASRAISHARGHLRVARTTEKRETARSLLLTLSEVWCQG